MLYMLITTERVITNSNQFPPCGLQVFRAFDRKPRISEARMPCYMQTMLYVKCRLLCYRRNELDIEPSPRHEHSGRNACSQSLRL